MGKLPRNKKARNENLKHAREHRFSARNCSPANDTSTTQAADSEEIVAEGRQWMHENLIPVVVEASGEVEDDGDSWDDEVEERWREPEEEDEGEDEDEDQYQQEELIIDEEKLEDYATIMKKAQEVAATEEKARRALNRRPKHYLKNSSRSQRRWAQVRRELAESGQKFIGSFFSSSHPPVDEEDHDGPAKDSTFALIAEEIEASVSVLLTDIHEAFLPMCLRSTMLQALSCIQIRNLWFPRLSL